METPDQIGAHEPDAYTRCGTNRRDAEDVGEYAAQVFVISVSNVTVTGQRAVRK